MQVPKSTGRIDAIQAMRAVAALLVVVTHAIGTYDDRTDLPRSWLGSLEHFNSFGAIGVDIFFVISGFIMAHTVASRPSMGGWEFLSLRFVRVMPIYWLASLAMLAMLTIGVETPDWQRIVGGLLIFPVTSAAEYDVPVLRVGWSLTFEIAFYLAIALVISLVTKPSLRVLGAMALVCVLAGIGAVYQPQSAASAIFFNAIWFEFALGLGIYEIWCRVKPSRLIAWAVLGIGTLVMVKYALFGPAIFDGPWALITPDPVHYPNGRTGMERALGWGIPSAMVVVGLLWCTAGMRLAGNRFWAAILRLGDASYALYLVHPFITDAWKYLAPSNAIPADLVILAMISASVVVAQIVHGKIEQPLLLACRARMSPRSSDQRKVALV